MLLRETALLTLIFIGYAATKEPDYEIPKVVEKAGKRGEPGASGRITSIGLAYLREIGMSLLNKKVRQLEFKEAIKNKSPVGNGFITIENIKIIDYWPPESYDLELVPTQQFAWIMKGLGVRAAGQFKTDIQLGDAAGAKPIIGAGDWDILIDYMDFDMTIEMGKDSNGYPTVKATNCHVTVHGLDLQVTNAGLLTTVMEFLRGMISNQVKPQIATQICEKASAMVNEKANEMMKTLPLKKSLADFGEDKNTAPPPNLPRSRGRKKRAAAGLSLDNGTVKELIDRIRNKNMIVDITLTEAPRTSKQGFAQTKHVGEIAWVRESTPFYPAPMKYIEPQGKEMLQLFVSDYMINSLLYSIHKHQLMDIRLLADSSPELEKQLVTTCDNVCLGDLFYPVADEYPDHYIDLDIKTLKMPTVIFLDGRAAVLIAAQTDMYVRHKKTKKSTKVVESELNLAAYMAADINSDDPQKLKLTGAVKLERLELKLIDSPLDGVDQDTMDLLADVVKEILDAALNGALKKGIDLPSMEGLQMISPTLRFNTNQMTIDTYFKIEEAFLEKLIPN